MGMQNSLRTLSLNGFDTQPNDVELVEILVKDSVSNSIYLVYRITCYFCHESYYISRLIYVFFDILV